MQQQFERGETYIDVHGKVTYSDAVGTSHWTQFCETIASPESKPLLDTSSCVGYNTVDDNK